MKNMGACGNDFIIKVHKLICNKGLLHWHKVTFTLKVHKNSLLMWVKIHVQIIIVNPIWCEWTYCGSKALDLSLSLRGDFPPIFYIKKERRVALHQKSKIITCIEFP